MKVSSIIKTPVLLDGALIYELMDWQTHTGKPTKINRWSAPIQGADNIRRAQIIAHAIDSHDALVDMVKGLSQKLYSIGELYSNFNDPFQITNILREADELLKKEK